MRLDQILDKAGFDNYVESLCQRFYAEEVGRPGLPGGRYLRLLLIGDFQGLDGERARRRRVRVAAVYMVNGEQFVTVASRGGDRGRRGGDLILSFALPRP